MFSNGQKKIRIIGIDPGSRRTGYGVCDLVGPKLEYVCSGVIKLPTIKMPERLKIIHQEIINLIETHRPNEMAVEDVFFAKDPRAALKLGQARGAALVAGALSGLEIGEYSPRTVKQSVVGTGAAAKEQVQIMVMHLLSLAGRPAEDAADALAIAICHAHHLSNNSLTE